MSYADYQIEQVPALPTDLATDADYLLAPGYSPFTLRAAAVVITTTTAVGDIVVTINHQPTAGSDTGAAVVETITVPSGTAQGEVVYVDGFEQLVRPGEAIEFAVTGSGTGSGFIKAFYEPCWDSPANNANMTESA